MKFVYDADDDRELSEEERATMLADFTERCEAIHERLVEAFDLDGDGELSEEEKQAARDEMEARKPEHEGCGGEDMEGGERAEGAPTCPVNERSESVNRRKAVSQRGEAESVNERAKRESQSRAAKLRARRSCMPRVVFLTA